MDIRHSNEFGKLRIQDLVDFEETNDIKLPEDYKQFLIEHNGGRPHPCISPIAKSEVQWIYCMVYEPNYASLFWHIEIFQKRIPSWYFPIANDSRGNLYLMSLSHENFGLIAFWDHEGETDGDADQYFDNMKTVANSFTEFLNQLIEE
jgi:hypothetical protein